MAISKPRAALTGMAAVFLGGCTTFSFAPPVVQTEYKAARSSLCAPQIASTEEITRDYRGARNLIDNFTSAYRCSVAEAADGRQIFEVPSFLALVAGAIGPTFGLDSDGRIAAVASASVLGRANAYYAPREKLPALDAALDAVLCIKAESIGIAFFDTRQGDADQMREAVGKTQQQIAKLKTSLASLQTKRATAVSQLQALEPTVDASSSARAALVSELANTDASIRATDAELAALEAALSTIADPAKRIASVIPLRIAGADPSVAASANEQYFEMVSSALFSVERVLGGRLKAVGKFDAAGLQAEIADAIAKMKDADAKLIPKKSLLGLSMAEQAEEVQLRINAIQPRLQACVVRAKLG
jgi:hypothetical protein